MLQSRFGNLKDGVPSGLCIFHEPKSLKATYSLSVSPQRRRCPLHGEIYGRKTVMLVSFRRPDLAFLSHHRVSAQLSYWTMNITPTKV